MVLRQFGSNDPAAAPPMNKVVLGVKMGPVSPAIAAAAGFHSRDGAFVIDVMPGGAAERAGIKAGDILVRIADREIKSGLDVQDTMASMSPDAVTTVRVFRQGAQSDITVAF